MAVYAVFPSWWRSNLFAWRARRLPSSWGKIIALWLLLVLAADAGMASSALAGEDLTDLKLRVAWGGGQSRAWVGEVSVDRGAISDLTLLGLEPDSARAIFLASGNVRIEHPSPRAYDAFDILVRAPISAVLRIRLEPADRGAPPSELQVPLADLVGGFRNLKIDDQDNQLLVRRSPGDTLRIEFPRNHLVFQSGEKFELSVKPHLASLPPSAEIRCNLRLFPTRSDRALWSESRSVMTDAQGRSPPWGGIVIPLPSEEGVYDLDIQLHQPRLVEAIVGSKALLERKIQLVVIDEKPPGGVSSSAKPSSREKWKTIFELDPANPHWWERLTQWPQLSVLPSFGKTPLNNGTTRPRKIGDREFMELDLQGWQAYPLPVARTGSPYIVEVEYPPGASQTLGVSVIEPNEAGAIGPMNHDSGFLVAPLHASFDQEQEKSKNDRLQAPVHRLLFWPRTKAPLLLLTNRSQVSPAIFGKIRVLEGPLTLPPQTGSDPRQNRSTVRGWPHQPQRPDRMLAVYYDKPLFPENFGAEESLDEKAGRTLDDWRTFHQGAKRLINYLKWMGYNGVIMCVACEGSAIYPSRFLAPTPKYDTGGFFSSGQDPLRKDVLEMLLRMFDREGLRFVPAVHFSAPLPELEHARQSSPTETYSLAPIGPQGADWLRVHGSQNGLAPYYQPLHPRVQTAMGNVMRELLARYGHHSSLAGIAVALGPQSYAQLPASEWTLDDQTVGQFQHDLQVTIPAGGINQGPHRFSARADYVRGGGGDLWRHWRAARLGDFYLNLRDEIIAYRPDADLYVLGGDLFTGGRMEQQLRPALPLRANPQLALFEAGFDPRLFQGASNLVFARPYHFAPGSAAPVQAAAKAANRSEEIDRLFAKTGAALFVHAPAPLELASFDQANPFGNPAARTWLAPQITPAGSDNRRRFLNSLRYADQQAWIEGGWRIPLGQDDSLRPLFDVFRRLPAQRFQDVPLPRHGRAGPPVVFRRLWRRGELYYYLANISPWPVEVQIRLAGSRAARIESLSRRPANIRDENGGWKTWRVELEPYDLQGIVIRSDHNAAGANRDTPNAAPFNVEDWTVHLPSRIAQELGRQTAQLRLRANMLQRPPPDKVLENPGFELATQENGIPGWVHAEGEGVKVAIDRATQFEGGQSLLIKNTGAEPVWIRSRPFYLPPTGRIAVLARIKGRRGKRPPLLRLAIEGVLNGKVYYRFASIGAGPSATPLHPEWAQYVLPLNDLPSTGLTDLRVGFDLMSQGQVWIDDVQVHSLWFQQREQHELRQNIALADFQREKGRVVECLKYLEGYWPWFLMHHVPAPSAPRVARQDPPQPDQNADTDKPKKRGVFRKIERLRKRLLRF